MSAPPVGTVTFLFTDLQGSTRLWERHPIEMAMALERHDALCRDRFERSDGYVFATTGDGFGVAFARPSDALATAVDLQAAFAAERWPDPTPLAVRMALHAGEAVERDGDYFGTAVNTAARLLAVGHAGQVIASDTVRQLAGDDDRFHDLGRHRLRDLGAPVRVWQIGDGRFPPLRSLDATPGNLPSHLTPLIGRDDELADLVRAMASHRLVTLTGVGGVGKTRLALAAAGEVAAELPDGSWFVDLSTRETDDDLAAAVSLAIGAEATATERRLLLDHLRDRRLLLVLDNCEHVIDAAAELADDILSATDDVVLLVTSREPLGIDGEHVHRVRSLALTGKDANDVAAAPAVALFVERAREAAAVIDLDADGPAIVEICGHLDGIPLAIELAAARTRAMSPAEMVARIDERFRLLGGGRRSRERHRTLVATVRWSHDLLTIDEQVVWRRLAVFVGGFDIEAAEAVVDRPDTIDALLSLVDKSMVQVDTTHGRTRYSMLETLRQFAADRLVDAGEVDETRARHAEHYRRRVGAAAAHMRGPDEHDAWQAAALDRDNVVVAAERLLEHGRHTELVESMTASAAYWTVVAPADGMRLLELAASRVDEELACRALSVAAFLGWEAGDTADVVRLSRAHVMRSVEGGRPPGGWALAALLIVGNFQPDVLTDDLVDAAFEAAEREDDDFLRVVVNSAGPSHLRRRGIPRWDEPFDAAERAAARLGSSSSFVTVAAARASTQLLEDGEGEEAADATLRAVEHRVSKATSTAAGWFHVLAAGARFDRDRARAIAHLHEAIRVGDQLGVKILANLGYEGIALAWTTEERFADAAVLRAVTRTYFEEAGRARGGIGGRWQRYLDLALAAALSTAELAEAEERARTVSRQELLDLALERT